ncbi:MAG: gamma-glutamylcyclotransferase family protein [Anaerolineae bacterium]
MSETEQLFVYGTLRPPRPGARAEHSRFYPALAPYVLSATPARIEDAALYDLGVFPGARPGDGTVHGDLLKVRPEALDLTDQIEGHPRLFRRRRLTVQTEAGAVVAWIYWAPRDLVADAPRIVEGDWFKHDLRFS